MEKKQWITSIDLYLKLKLFDCVLLHVTYAFRVNLHSVIACMSKNSFLQTARYLEVIGLGKVITEMVVKST